MLKKLSTLLAVATLCTNMGIVAPISAQAATEETVIVESNFQNCNLGTYSAENQKNGETDLRNGVIMVDDSDLSTEYTIKKGDSYEKISEADIVNDNGERVLRLNTFLKPYKMTDGLTEADANYPVVKSIAKVPKNTKVKIDFELKMSPRVSFYIHHSKPNHVNWRIWRFEKEDGSRNKIKVLYNTDTGKHTACNVYNTHTVVMDTATNYMEIYQNGELVWEGAGNAPTWNQELFFRHITNMEEAYKPIVTYNDADNTKIESVVNPQYVYVKSVKMTTYTDTAFESVTPADGSSVMTPTEAVFTFNNTMEKVEKATVYIWGENNGVDVTSSLIFDGNTVKVPYAFEDGETYTVSLEGATDKYTQADAETTFTAEAWNFSNVIKNPVHTSPADNNTYYVNEDFTNSDDTTIITNKHSAWNVARQENASIVELEDGNKVLNLAKDSDFRLAYAKSLKHLDNATTLSYDVYIDEDAKQFNLVMSLDPVAMWQYGYYNYQKDGNSTAPMTVGEWHKVDIAISDETGKTIYVDGKVVHNIPEATKKLSEVEFFRFIALGSNVMVDNLKLYLDKSETVLTDATPAYDAKDVKASAPLAFTYNEVIGDVSGAKLIVKPNDTNAATVLTNGNGMSVTVENNTVQVILDQALNANLGYAVELSGLKDIRGAIVSPVRTRFSTIADDAEWMMTDVNAVVSTPLSKTYSFKLKHQGAAVNTQLIAATYNYDGSLSSVAYGNAKSVDSNWADFSVQAEYGASKTTKLFIWDSVNGMKPIFDAILK